MGPEVFRFYFETLVQSDRFHNFQENPYMSPESVLGLNGAAITVPFYLYHKIRMVRLEKSNCCDLGATSSECLIPVVANSLNIASSHLDKEE